MLICYVSQLHRVTKSQLLMQSICYR